MASKARIESNKWLRENCKDIEGRVLSIGSLDDSDGEGKHYRDYFPNAQEYTTSEVDFSYNCDLVLDVTDMKGVKNEEYDCVWCGGVLEHVYDFQNGMNEITRILKKGGALILGLPFRQAVHMDEDYWRFTDQAIRKLLEKDYNIEKIAKIFEEEGQEFPITYIAKAVKI